MKVLPIDITGLIPAEAKFQMSTHGDREFTLCKWTLRVRSWATTKYGPERLKVIFEHQDIGEIAEIAWFMLKDDDKKFFNNSKDTFLDGVSSVQDQINLIKALMATVGIGEPEFEKVKEMTQAIQDEKKSPPPPTEP